jgi:hypothetical protein
MINQEPGGVNIYLAPIGVRVGAWRSMSVLVGGILAPQPCLTQKRRTVLPFSKDEIEIR